MEHAGASHKADHICVLVHGLWGTPAHLVNVAKALREKHPENELHILVAKRNSGSFTYDGIELGGERVCQEIEEELKRLEDEGQLITKISIVGYSLGGLVARYAIGLLDSRGTFDKLEPLNFTTIATPHLGVRTPLRSWHNHMWNVVGARTLSMSGRQLFTIDNFRETGRPLLAVLADPKSIFVKGLARFKRRTLYANIVNDRSAVYYTTAISKNDPFADLSNIKLNYLDGYDDVILDPKEPLVLEDQKASQLTFYSRLAMDSQTIINRLPRMLPLVIFLPIGLVALLINAGIQTISSSRRIRLHEAGQAGIAISSYRMPFLIGVQGAVEDVYENLNSAQSSEYLSSASEEEALIHEASGSPRSGSIINNTAVHENGSLEKTPVASVPNTTSGGNLDLPTLALSADQFAMIQALDELGWRKYPVHIHKVGHSHAAIIVRKSGERYGEGWIVLRHWLDEEFLMS